MGLQINKNPPQTMWIDMNASFATAEQQAHPRMRNKPIGVGKYTNPNGPVISPSVEAKRYGIKTAHNVRDCRLLCPDIVIVKSDPPKYREMHRRMIKIFKQWSPDVLGKSIDEACICFDGSPALKTYSMQEIALTIKQQIKEDCGEYVRVSIGIASNQFLAKVAAGLKKPDGLKVITHENLREVFSKLNLTDLCGINSKYAARLNMNGILTPLEFLDADPAYLHHTVFNSIIGRYWNMMLHGYEHQNYEGFERKTFGNSHSIREQTHEKKHNLAILCKLCDMASRRMRRDSYSCRTVSILILNADGSHAKGLKTVDQSLYSTKEIFRIATLLFNRQKEFKVIHKIAVRLSNLQQGTHEQLDLFETDKLKSRRAMGAVDRLNDRYGEQVVFIGSMFGAKDRIDDSISFGSTGDVQQLYDEESAFEVIDDCPDTDLFQEDKIEVTENDTINL